MEKQRDIRLFLLFIGAIVLVVFSQAFFTEAADVPNAEKARESVRLAGSWMKIIQREKELQHLLPAEAHRFPSEALLGDDFSPMTTTLGSLEAKKISVNPQFAGVVVRWLTELGLDSTDEVLVASSGSFPGLAISTLAALQTLNQRAVLTTSVGASSFGANQPAMTMIDIGSILSRKSNLRYRPELITYGCDNDGGGGFYEGGKDAVDSSARRNDVHIWTPAALEESIAARLEIAQSHHVRLLINIGGNHAMMGNCAHASSWPNGLHRSVQTCTHDDRGAIARMHESGIPVIHFLNITELGLKNGIVDSYSLNDGLYKTRRTNPIAVSFFLVLLSAAIVTCRFTDTPTTRK